MICDLQKFVKTHIFLYFLNFLYGEVVNACSRFYMPAAGIYMKKGACYVADKNLGTVGD